MLKNLISKSVSLALISAGITPVAHADFKVNDVSVNNPKGTTITNSTNTDTFNGAVKLDNGGTIDNITNDGTLSATADTNIAIGTYITNSTTLTNLTNSGTISGTTNALFGIAIGITSDSSITNLTNSGTISGTSDLAARGVFLDGSSSVTNLVNSGTISINSTSDASDAVHVNDSTITNFTNSGTISATVGGDQGYGFLVTSEATITSLTNSGTISASTTGESAGGIAVISSSTLTTLTNSGTISGTSNSSGGFGVYIDGSSTMTTLFNSGTISGTANSDAKGINLDSSSTLTTLTNIGTISGTASSGAAGIHLNSADHLINFNNLQTGLVYSGRLPRNYSTIIKGDSYGQLQISGTPSEASTGDTVYAPFAGNTSVPVHIKSKTYSNVMTGIPDANLNDTISGTLSGDGENSIGSVNWQLSNTSGNNWDLITSGGTYTYVGKANTQTAINNTASSVSNSFKGMSAGGNFANMTTYDCNYFGAEDGCISIGVRETKANGTDTKAVLVAGKKVSDTFRYGGFVDQTIAHHGYKDIDIDPKIPLIGMMGVWNKSDDNKGLQVKLANSYQKNEATITRSAVSSSELAKGTTDIETQSYIVEASYLNEKEIRPFAALRYMKTKQAGYREKNVNAPMIYSKAVEESTDILSGIKANYKINDSFTVNYALGLEHSLNDNSAQLVGDIAGISDFKPVSVGGEKEKTRKFASMGFTKLIDSKVRLEGKIMHQELRYKNSKDATTIYVTYSLPF
ncbi:autotransporter domain-containing protein [Candidatus Pelagibacter sp.]|nr:autotransporter domain-containing protein [Candidatus Pelagibacter sp.]